MTVFKRILVALVVLNVVGWSIYAYERHSAGGRVTSEESARIAAAAAKFQQAKAMSAQDYTRWRLLADQTQRIGSISNLDLRYTLGLMNTQSSYPPFVHLNCALLLDQIKVYQPGQREAIYQAGIPLLASKDPIDKIAGLKIVIHLGDARAVPDVLPLVKDPDTRVSKLSAAYLKKVGYGNGTSPSE